LLRKLIATSLVGLLSSSPVFAQQQAPAPVAPTSAPALYEGTPIKLRLKNTLSSANAITGQEIEFEVTENVVVNGVVVIRQGAHAIGSVTEAEHKKWAGRAGKLLITLSSVRLVDGEKCAIKAQAGGDGHGHTGAMVGAMAATAIFTLGGSALFLLMHGKDIVIPENTPLTAFVYDDMKLDLSKFAI
jgi:hypothetical protein